MKDLSIIGKRDIMNNVRQENGQFSLTDLWKLAGGDVQRTPAKWQESEPVQRFLQTACKFLNVGISDIIKSKRGKGGGTWGHRQVALEYAQYLDPKYAVLVNEVFFERIEEEKNPDLIIDRAISTYQKKGYTADWISKRISGKGTRNEFTTTLAKHGVMGDGYQRCTNAMYIELYGKDAKGVREKKGIPEKANIRENMSTVELQAIQFAEALAKDDIERNRRYGNEECAIVSNHAARSVKESINSFRNNSRLK
ncbi:KilA-N domain-containing protein [Sphingobacterium sp.]|uniref:KilA-N domain-containing protein n=1 Tax=Sphingobacterium sp. TaxID=341027 RepID=UPI0028AFEFB3|nr:KilA-N domain-containing protein [Sphingobacterium sp.]